MKKQLDINTISKIRESRKQTALKRQSQVVNVYELKINKKRLNKKQLEELEMVFLEGKRFYNFILGQKKEQGIPLNCITPTDFHEITYLDKDKNIVNYELKYLRSSSKQTIHARMISNEKTIRTLIKKGLQTHGGLKFKSELMCIPLKNTDWKFKSENKVWITGIKGKVLVRGTRQFNRNEVEFANANLIKKPDGYYLKITVYTDKEKVKQTNKNNRILGLDFGIKTNITTSEGTKIDISIEESDRLKSLQKKMQRQKRGSNNRYKTIKKLKIAYQKQIQQKQDKANKFISQMKKYDKVIYQDEQIAKWHQEYGMSKNVQHSCIGLVKAKLGQLCNTVKLNQFIPTTKWCPNCGSIKNDITLSDREYVCHCGYQEDRDVHAAKNMINIWRSLVETNFVPTDGREVKLEDWQKYQVDPRSCSVFS